MKRNNDAQVVVLDVDMYKELTAMARTSERYLTKRIERHARKMNPYLQPDHQALVLTREQTVSKRIRECRKVIEETRGKVVYIRTSVNYYEPLEDTVYTPMVIKCINQKQRYLLDIHKVDVVKPGHYDLRQITPDCVELELPDDYYQICFGVYNTLWVKQWSPMHWYAIIEEARAEDHQRDEYKRKMELPINTDPQRFVTRLQDVIGER